MSETETKFVDEKPERQCSAVTDGIRVEVQSHYIESQSSSSDSRYVFAYQVRVSNEGEAPAQLISRHWVITHGDGKTEEVRGPGVVGHQPLLQPGQSFEYSSGCILKTPWGTMHGEYQMVRPDGAPFDADIAPFLLQTPFALN